ncbi:MAG: DUF5107 domain-containing protein [Anaerolineae bacterium]
MRIVYNLDKSPKDAIMVTMMSRAPGSPGGRFTILVVLVLVIACRPAGPREHSRGTLVDTHTGVLRIVSEPQGAEVVVNGQARGRTPLEIRLPAGGVHVSVAAPGYADWENDYLLAAASVLTATVALRDIRPPRALLVGLPVQVQAGTAVAVSGQASDNDSVSTLTLAIDGDLLCKSPGPTLSCTWDTTGVAPGTHVVRLEATDRSGNTTHAEQQVTINLPMPTATSPIATPSATSQSSADPPGQPVTVRSSSITLTAYGYQQAWRADPGSPAFPYPRLDRGSIGPPVPVTLETVVLENEYLRLVFLPALGGRLYQCTYLPTGQNLFYNNTVLKPSPWGPPDLGWWLAVGGMEWCLPVDEHGYVTAETWSAETARTAAGGAAVILSHLEQTHNLLATVTVKLEPKQASFRVTLRLENRDAAPKQYQYWLNAMVSPGSHSLPTRTRFLLPASEVVVHSTGDSSLGGAHALLPWPVAAGRDLSRYENWRNYLGVFAPRVQAGFAGVYSPEHDLGLVRVFPIAEAPGVKLFAFGSGFDPSLYTDDGSQYAEIWGGLTPTFWDYATLPGNGSVTWSETWVPVHGLGGLSGATADVAYAVELGNPLRVALSAARPRSVVVVVADSLGELARESAAIGPEQICRLDVTPRAAGGAPVLRVYAAEGGLLAEVAMRGAP